MQAEAKNRTMATATATFVHRLRRTTMIGVSAPTQIDQPVRIVDIHLRPDRGVAEDRHDGQAHDQRRQRCNVTVRAKEKERTATEATLRAERPEKTATVVGVLAVNAPATSWAR